MHKKIGQYMHFIFGKFNFLFFTPHCTIKQIQLYSSKDKHFIL